MADEPAMTERFLLWWRRNLAVAYVLAGSFVFGLVVLFWYGYGPVTAARMWSATHGHIAALHGAPVKLPAGWREQNSVARSDLHLVKPSPWRGKAATVDVDEFPAHEVDFARMMNTLQSLEKMAVEQGDVSAAYPLSDANAARFACLEHGKLEDGTLHVTCLTRDGRRVVRMVGDEDGRADFAVILTSIAGAR